MDETREPPSKRPQQSQTPNAPGSLDGIDDGSFELALDAPPIPHQMRQTRDAARTRLMKPRGGQLLVLDDVGPSATPAAPAPLRFDFRDNLPPYVPEGEFNSGVAVAWVVVALTSAAVLTWHLGPEAMVRFLSGL